MKIKFQATVTEENVKESSEDDIKEMVSQSRWQEGIAVIGKHKFKCLRRKSLDGWTYRKGNQILPSVDEFNPTEYFDWRDG